MKIDPTIAFCLLAASAAALDDVNSADHASIVNL